MPEGHVLHHLARQHQRWFGGQVVRTSSPQGRFAEGAAAIDGRHLVKVEAKGKHAFYHFGAAATEADGDVLHVHLGLYGRTRRFRNPAPEPRGAVRLRMTGDERTWDLIGPTRCELLSPEAYRAKLDQLGEDPLREDADPAPVYAKLSKTRRAIGAVLLDQSVIAGLGNVYRSELAFLAGVSPYAPARDLPAQVHQELWRNAVTLLQVGVRHNAIRVLGEADVIGPRGGEAVIGSEWTMRGRYGRRQDRLWVYKRASCKVCQTPIEQDTIGARTAYFCPSCQGVA